MNNTKNTVSVEKKLGRIILKFGYNEPLKDELKKTIRFPDCQWDNDNRAWSIKDDAKVIDAAYALFEKYGINADELIRTGTDKPKQEVVANWYPISELNQEYFSYYLNLPETDDIQAMRYRVANALNNLNDTIDVALNFDKILSTEELTDEVCSKYSLRFQKMTSDDSAHEVMFREVLKKELGDDDYDNMYGRLISKSPICVSGDYELYQKHEMRVRTFGKNRVLQMRNSTIRSSIATIQELRNKGKIISEGQRLKHTYDGTICQFHGYVEGNANTTPLDQLGGLTLLEYMQKQGLVDKRKLRAVKALLNNPDSRLVWVSYSRSQRQKGDYKTSAECLLKEVVDNDTLPTKTAREFMKHSHISIRERFLKSMIFRTNLEQSSISEKIGKKMVSVKDLGFEFSTFSEKNITFNGIEKVGWSAKDLSSSFRRHGALNQVKKHIKVALIPFGEFTPQHQSFIDEVLNFLEKGSESCEFIGPEKPYGQLNINEARLSREYEDLKTKADVVLIEIDQRDEIKWQVWKKAANRINIRNQMFTSKLLNDRFAPMNVAFGLISKMGGVTFTAHEMETEIETWIGLDVGRRPGSNLGASCVAFEANGKQIGWAAPEILQGERITPRAFRNILTNIIEEVNILREREGRQPLKKLGILRDGRFYELMSVVEELEQKFSLEINVFEVRKSGAPRLAIRNGLEISACEAGTCVWKGNWGFLQPNAERKQMGSPTVYQIHALKSSQAMSKVLHDIFWLSKMHIGATMQPGLPVPIHFADRLSKYAGLGVIRNSSFTTNLDFL